MTDSQIRRSFGRVHDRHVDNEIAHRLRDLQDADRLLAHEVVDPTRCTRTKRRHDAVAKIFHVNELSALPTITGHDQRFAGPSAGHERSDDRRFAGAWAERNAEAQADGVETVELSV